MLDTKPDLLPPHNGELEAAFLGCLLLADRDGIAEVMAGHRDLPGYFYDLRHQAVFDAIKELSDGNQPADPVSVHAHLSAKGRLEDAGGLVYVQTLPERAPTSGMAAHYAEQLRDLFVRRTVIQAAGRLTAAAYAGQDAAGLLDATERELCAVATDNAPAEVSIKALVQGALAQIEAATCNGGKPTGLATGFPDLDRLTHGLRPGQLFVIGARPGVGKTTLAANIASHVSLEIGRGVGFIELEMTAAELTMRLLSARSRVPMDQFLSGLHVGDVPKVASASSALVRAPLFIADEAGITVAQMRAKARRMHRKHKLALLVVDYLQLIRPSRPNASRNVEVSEISSSLKALAKELAIPVIALSQLNRGSDSEGRPPSLRDLRDSGSIEQDADIVGLLHSPDPTQNAVTLDIAKHRQGPRRKIDLVFFGETFQFQCAARCSGDD
jgi:replicative DNA helicase